MIVSTIIYIFISLTSFNVARMSEQLLLNQKEYAVVFLFTSFYFFAASLQYFFYIIKYKKQRRVRDIVTGKTLGYSFVYGLCESVRMYAYFAAILHSNVLVVVVLYTLFHIFKLFFGVSISNCTRVFSKEVTRDSGEFDEVYKKQYRSILIVVSAALILFIGMFSATSSSEWLGLFYAIVSIFLASLNHYLIRRFLVEQPSFAYSSRVVYCLSSIFAITYSLAMSFMFESIFYITKDTYTEGGDQNINQISFLSSNETYNSTTTTTGDGVFNVNTITNPTKTITTKESTFPASELLFCMCGWTVDVGVNIIMEERSRMLTKAQQKIDFSAVKKYTYNYIRLVDAPKLLIFFIVFIIFFDDLYDFHVLNIIGLTGVFIFNTIFVFFDARKKSANYEKQIDDDKEINHEEIVFEISDNEKKKDSNTSSKDDDEKTKK